MEDQFSADDDVNIADYADSPLIKIAERLIKRREPEFINVRHAKGFEDETNDVIGLSSRKAILAYYRTVDTDSVGVKFIRQFLNVVENFENIPIGIIGKDKFTPSAKKEATDRNIILVSEREIKETKGTVELQKLNDRLIQGAREILIQRNFTIVTKTTPEFMKLIAGSQSLGTYVLAENAADEAIIVLIPFEEVVRVATVREFHDQMIDLNITEGMLIPLNRFTYTAEREARNFSIAVLRKNHPVFNIFSHGLVPEHQILTRDEIDEILIQYNARISNLPKLFEDDPAAIAVNAQIGDVVRILRSHDNFMYRLVIPRVEAGITAESVMADMMVDRRKRLGKKK
jgi:DNA-directed RNA polymerase subunit H